MSAATARLQTMPSYNSMDKLHFQATGEHLPPARGDEAPHPVEWHILKTQQRQQRARAYEFHRQEATKGDYSMVPIKTSRVNGVAYNAIQRGMNNELFLYYDTKEVMVLYPDGKEVSRSACPSAACSPVPKFCLGAPPGRETVCSPVNLGAPAEAAATGIQEIPAPTSRLRANFRRFLQGISDEMLRLEYEEWEEEMHRAIEHMEAVEEEMARRGRS